MFRPLGWDWRVSAAVIAGFPAREVVVAVLGTIYAVGDEADEQTWPASSRSALAPDGSPVFTLPMVLGLLLFYAWCLQCAATLAVIRRETNSWRWPVFAWSYMTALGYGGALLIYQLGDGDDARGCRTQRSVMTMLWRELAREQVADCRVFTVERSIAASPVDGAPHAFLSHSFRRLGADLADHDRRRRRARAPVSARRAARHARDSRRARRSRRGPVRRRRCASVSRRRAIARAPRCRSAS